MTFEADVDLSDWQQSMGRFSAAADDKIARMLTATAEQVADDARRLVPRGATGRARASLKAMGATVVMGDSRVPYAGFLSFGGRVGIKESVRRTWVPGGRYIWPAWMKNQRDTLTAMEDGLRDLARESGL